MLVFDFCDSFNEDTYNELNDFLKSIFKRSDKEEFSSKYISFACELKNKGYVNEALYFMRICDMIRDAISRPGVLKTHQEFFNKLFSRFNELFVCNADEYDVKYWDSLVFITDCECYYFTEVYTHSPKYDEAVCDEILSYLSGGLK